MISGFLVALLNEVLFSGSTVGPPYALFCFSWFQLHMVNCDLKILSEKFQKYTMRKF